jgi:hypothetical protein
LVQTVFFDLSDLGLTNLSHPDIFFFSYFKFVSRWRDSCAIFPLQRNGENRGGVEMVSFGLQNGEKQSFAFFFWLANWGAAIFVFFFSWCRRKCFF